jgi:hypothetical protein
VKKLQSEAVCFCARSFIAGEKERIRPLNFEPVCTPAPKRAGERGKIERDDCFPPFANKGFCSNGRVV